MPILDFFKKKPKEKEKIKKKKEAQKPSKVEIKKKSPPSASRRSGKKKRKDKVPQIAPLVLRESHITEKATDLKKENQYVFKVYRKANKDQIKKAIEELYGVKVTGVRVINIPKKPRRLGKTPGFRRGYKKAIVAIKKGEKIETLSQ